MTDIDFADAPSKIFGTVEASVDLAEVVGNDEAVKRDFSALKQVPIRFYRDNVIACEGDPAEYIFFVVRGVVRSCRNFKAGVRNIVAFYLPGDFLGWTGLKHSLEAATDAEVLFIKRSSSHERAVRAGTSLFLGFRPVATPASSRGQLVCGSSGNTRSLQIGEEVSKRQITTVPKQVSSWARSGGP